MEVKYIDRERKSLGKIKLPFYIKFVHNVGGQKRIVKSDVLDILDLNAIINLGLIHLKEKNAVNHGSISLEIGSMHSGLYTVNLTLDEFAMLYNMQKEMIENSKNEEAEIG